MSEFSASPSFPRRLAARLPACALSALFWIRAGAAWFVLLFVLSSMPGGGGPDFPTHADKVAHFLYFAGGGFALANAFQLRRSPLHPLVFVVIVLVAGTLVGGFDEWHQTFTKNRSGLDIGDWIADVLGTATGVAASIPALRWLRANTSFPSLPTLS